MLLEPLLIGVKHAIEPRQKFLGAVVGMQDHGNTVRRCNRADVVCCGDGASNGRFLVLVLDTLATEVRGTTLAELEDDGGFGIARSFECGNGGGGRSDIDRRDGEVLLLSVFEELLRLSVGKTTAFSCGLQHAHSSRHLDS